MNFLKIVSTVLTLEQKMTSEIQFTGGGTVGGRGGDNRELVSVLIWRYKICMKVGVACWGRGLGWLNTVGTGNKGENRRTKKIPGEGRGSLWEESGKEREGLAKRNIVLRT